jgi:hypothetical protein
MECGRYYHPWMNDLVNAVVVGTGSVPFAFLARQFMEFLAQRTSRSGETRFICSPSSIVSPSVSARTPVLVGTRYQVQWYPCVVVPYPEVGVPMVLGT